MCDNHEHVDRRRFLRGLVAGAGGLLVAGIGGRKAAALGGGLLPADGFGRYRALAHKLSSGSGATPGDLHVYVLVTDGLRSDEIHPILTPNLAALRDTGTHFVSAQCQHVAETLPNHVAMMTGVTAASNGVPGNNIYDRELGARRTLENPDDIWVDTLFETFRGEVSTACVQSKDYLHKIFEGKADHEWAPGPQIPESDHAPDNFTMDATLEIVEAYDPRFMFVNLGDIDRSGHADPSGAINVPAFRTTVLSHTDLQIGRFVDALRAIPGRWESSVVIVVADHSMDWSLPNRYVHLTPVYQQDEILAGNFEIGQNGGASLVYWLGDPADREVAVGRMRDLALAQEGVLSVHGPEELGLGSPDRAGDVVVFLKPGWRVTDPSPHSNPIPGNHGHPVTMPIPFIVSGGAPFLRQSWVDQTVARNVDVAPTVASLFGYPVDGYDGVARTEAFVA